MQNNNPQSPPNESEATGYNSARPDSRTSRPATAEIFRTLHLALQLRFLRSSESIGHHDSEIVDDGYFDRDDAGALGVIAAGCQSADGAIVHPGAGGGF